MSAQANSTLQELQSRLEETEARLADREKMFAALLEATLAGWWDWRIQENTEYMSPSFKRMFGYEDHEIENVPEAWQKIIHPDDLPGVFELFNAHVSSKGSVPYDNSVRYYHKDGSIVWVYCRGKVVEWRGDTPIRMVGTHVNVTPLKTAEARINALNEDLVARISELERRNADLDIFAQAMSHDLKEPLRIINNFSGFIREDNENLLDSSVIHLERIQTLTEKMQMQLDAVLQHARVGSATHNALYSDLNQPCFDAIELLSGRIRESQAKVEVVGDLRATWANPALMVQLFQNLISNGLRYNESETPSVRIFRDRDRLIVEDNGIGIAKEHHHRIFELFSRLHVETEYNGGTGAGLAIVKRIVDRYGWKIKVESKQGEGARFLIQFKGDS